MKIKHLATGVAIAATLAIGAPGWSQGPAPSGRSYGGFSGSSSNPGQGPMATTPAWENSAASAMPPMHRTARAGHATTHRRMAAQPVTASTAEQLNQQELARVQAGGAMPPPAPMSGPNTGGPSLAPYSH
jgi:hypothetical protein